MYVALAALTVAHSLHLNLETVAESLTEHDAPPGRMKILSGINNSCIIDDSYNSSPVAADEALATLKWSIQALKKLLYLVTCLSSELIQKKEHEIGSKAAGIATIIYAVGTRSKWLYDSAVAAGFQRENIFGFADSEEAGQALKQILTPGDVVLIKGSQGSSYRKSYKGNFGRTRKSW